MRKAPIALLVAVAFGFVLGAGACDNKGSGGTPSATASASATAPASVTASATASASATVSASATASVSASASASATASVAAASDGGAAACGKKPLPDCPLQGWMKKNMEPAMSATDFPDLATQLDKTATFAPAGYTNWASISKDGAKAARAADLGGVKASCRSCHDQYKNKYKAEIRTRPVP